MTERKAYVVLALTGDAKTTWPATCEQAISEAFQKVDADCSIVSVLRLDNDGPTYGRHVIRSHGDIRLTDWAELK